MFNSWYENCVEDPKYYNEFMLSTTQANQCIDRFYDDSYSVIRYVTCLLIDFVYLSVNSWASLIVVLSCFLSKFWSSRAYYRLVTNKKLDANISERKRKYQHRVFYLHEYAKELRINKKISDMLMQDFKECNEELAQLNRHMAV